VLPFPVAAPPPFSSPTTIIPSTPIWIQIL
jgi:hypothetical protein